MFSESVVVQRSVHSSVVDGVMLAGLDADFVAPVLQPYLGTSLALTADAADAALKANPAARALYVVSPSYFGAFADIAALADVAHRHDASLVVDEAWGSHLGFHPELPVNAVREGADLVISSTHKSAKSLTQSAMLQLGHGEHARRLEVPLERAYRSLTSTSPSALLMLSLDEARRFLATRGT